MPRYTVSSFAILLYFGKADTIGYKASKKTPSTACIVALNWGETRRDEAKNEKMNTVVFEKYFSLQFISFHFLIPYKNGFQGGS